MQLHDLVFVDDEGRLRVYEKFSKLDELLYKMSKYLPFRCFKQEKFRQMVLQKSRTPVGKVIACSPESRDILLDGDYIIRVAY